MTILREHAGPSEVGDIGLLGGSFNPPHVGHLMLAAWALATQRLDALWLLPAYRHPFGKQLAPFGERVRMCELAVDGLRGAKVSRAEEELRDDPLVGRTVRTLEYLAARHPEARFTLVLGADILAETASWYRFDRVQELARVVVVGRQGHPEARAGGPALPEISSTAVRAALARSEDVSRLVPSAVLEYIAARGLYVGGV